jgi:hypothetical protein
MSERVLAELSGSAVPKDMVTQMTAFAHYERLSFA